MSRRALLAVTTLILSCATQSGSTDDSTRGAIGPHPELPARPGAYASRAFWATWGDGRAELSGYAGRVSRYGELREAETVLIYVTEPHDRRTWIKSDDVAAPNRVSVLKLNQSVKFITGIYPYSILTSIFAPVDGYFGERFGPAKITMSAQEWCGHVFAGVWPGRDRYLESVISY